MTPQSVAALLAAQRLEQVPPDLAAALARLDRAEQHLATAASLFGVDNEVAYGSLYDAARKAVTAHMLAHGLRARATAGAHEAVGTYAIERIADATGSVATFHQLRRRRNRSEYDDLVIGVLDLTADLECARNIVAAVRAALAAD